LRVKVINRNLWTNSIPKPFNQLLKCIGKRREWVMSGNPTLEDDAGCNAERNFIKFL